MGLCFVTIRRYNDSTRDERRQCVDWFEKPHVGVAVIAFLLDAGKEVVRSAEAFADANAFATVATVDAGSHFDRSAAKVDTPNAAAASFRGEKSATAGTVLEQRGLLS